MLDAYDYHLDIKLHPIFKVYSRFFEFDNPRIHLINSAIDSDYEVFITDYSSWVYDFVYLKRKILYFLPDEGFFSSGLNGYREVDIPLQDGFGPFAQAESSSAWSWPMCWKACGPVRSIEKQTVFSFTTTSSSANVLSLNSPTHRRRNAMRDTFQA